MATLGIKWAYQSVVGAPDRLGSPEQVTKMSDSEPQPQGVRFSKKPLFLK